MIDLEYKILIYHLVMLSLCMITIFLVFSSFLLGDKIVTICLYIMLILICVSHYLKKNIFNMVIEIEESKTVTLNTTEKDVNVSNIH